MAIRMAMGAQAVDVAGRVTDDVFLMVAVGALAGLALGFASARYIKSLLYQVRPSDPRMVILPALTMLAAALVAALPPVMRAVQIDLAATLRAESVRMVAYASSTPRTGPRSPTNSNASVPHNYIPGRGQARRRFVSASAGP